MEKTEIQTVFVDSNDSDWNDWEKPWDVSDGPDLVEHVDAADRPLRRPVQLNDVRNLWIVLKNIKVLWNAGLIHVCY